MASVLTMIGNSFLRRKNFLYKRVVNEMRKYATGEIDERINDLDQPIEIKETMTPLLSADDISQELCLRVRNEMINKHVSEQAVDTKILDICLRANKFQIARAYINCLQSNGNSISMYALARYLHFYYKVKPASSSEEDEIVDIFRKIQKECEHMPPSIMKNCIIALCKTDKWRLSIDLIEDYTNNKEISQIVTRHIIPVAFRNGEISLGLQLLYETNDPERECNMNFDVYKEYLNHYLQNAPTELNTAIEKIFVLWRKFNVVPIKFIVDLFVNTYNEAGWEAKYVAIKRDGYCYCCGNHLSNVTTNDMAFKKLAKSIIAKSLVAEDIFQNTTPLELQKFQNFISKKMPFDIVIDGLNVIYNKKKKKWLKDVVEYFAKDKKKILIIGRKHLFPMTQWTKLFDNVYIYFLEDITNDDPYMLYATLMSGNNAKFVTFDLLRQHIHKLDDKKMQRKFKRWQYTHQYSSFHNFVNDKVTMVEPWAFEPFAQCCNGYWHIPYRMDSEKFKTLHTPVDTWICFHRPEK